jgi:ubiquinone/menaquinone biosynthesis C-methylase UbiE
MPSFSTVTELPGSQATNQQRSMLYTRYHLARSHCVDKDVLEVACGAGLGLGYLSQTARSVVGADIDDAILNVARESYSGQRKVRLLKADAESLEFSDASFDTVLLFEAIYYLPNAAKFIDEARRVLRPDGTLLICTVNHRWHGFNRSPFAAKYFDAEELRRSLEQDNFSVQIFGGFPDQSNSLFERLVSAVRRVAVRWHLIPRTMKGKQWLKRLFYGRLKTLDREVHDQMAPLENLVELSPGVDSQQFRVLYAVARRQKVPSSKIAA